MGFFVVGYGVVGEVLDKRGGTEEREEGGERERGEKQLEM